MAKLPASSRDFLKAAAQRLNAAETLLREKLNLEAQYLGGYTAECALKALILHLTPEAEREDRLRGFRSGKMHDHEILSGVLRDLGIKIPLDLARRLRRWKWATALRYETGRRDTGETVAVLRTAKAVYNWVEEQFQ